MKAIAETRERSVIKGAGMSEGIAAPETGWGRRKRKFEPFAGYGRAGEELRGKRDYLERLNDSINEVIIAARVPGGIIEYANRPVENLLGYQPGECVGRKMEMVYPGRKEYLKFDRKLKSAIRRGEEVLVAECLLRRKGEKVFPAEVTATFLREESRPVQVILVVRDITGRKRAEHDLNERMKELRCIYGIADISERQDFTAEETYQAIAELLPASWQYPEIACARFTLNGREFRTGNYRETAWKQSCDIMVAGARAGKVEVGYLEEMPEIDEGPFLKEERLLIDAVAERLGRSAEHRRIAENLRTAEQNFRNSLDSSPLGVRIVTAEGETLYANQAMLDIYGYGTVEELRQTPARERYTPESYAEHLERKEKRKRGEPDSDHYEISVIRKDGEIRHLEVLRGEVLWDGGTQFQVIYSDVTERKKAKEKLVEYEELNKLKTNLLSTVSHELRTPLATIKGYSTMLLDYDRRLSPEEKRVHLQSIDRATDRLAELVDHLLDMSRLEAGLLKLFREPVSLSGLIQEAVADARLRTPDHEIVLDRPKRLPKPNIDARRVRQLLDNLIDNAIKYSEKGTRVVVSVRRMGGELLVSVSDRGVGISADEQEKVFDRMYRIEHRQTAEVKGVGLGLAICKGLVEAHGGRIWVESRKGEGSTFSFTLPL